MYKTTGFLFLMHRVELKVLLELVLSFLACRFLMHRVELKDISLFTLFTSTSNSFLMHRVELKDIQIN